MQHMHVPLEKTAFFGPTGKWMYTHTVRKEVAGEMVETRTNVSRQIYDQLLAQVSWQKFEEKEFKTLE